MTAAGMATEIDAVGNVIARLPARNPAAKTVSNCYLLGVVANGDYQRIADPPVNGSTHGYRCDYAYITPPKG